MVASGAGWAAATRIKSPAQVAAETDPPNAALIAVPVERKRLTTDVIVRGAVRHGTPLPLAIATSPVKPLTPIVTTVPERGTALAEGSVVLSLSGRPVIVLQGAQPAYRDMGVGTTGPDVQQLEAALERMALAPGPVDGVFDGATAAAMTALYQKAGSTPFGLTEAQRQELRSVADTAAAAEERRLQAKLALETAGALPPEVRQAEADLASARDAQAAAAGDLYAAAARKSGTQDAIQSAEAARAAAEATQRQDAQVAAAGVTNANNALNAAIQNENTARLRLTEAQTTVDPVTGQAASPATIATLQAEVDQAVAAIAGARADLAAAQAVADATAAGGAASVQAANAAVNQAVNEAGVAEADANRAAGTFERAGAGVSRAETVVNQMVRPAGTGTLREILDFATGEANRTGDELARLAEATSFQVPADEVLFVPELPARVDDVKVRPGETLSPDSVTLSSFTLAVDSALSLTDATLVKVGAPVTIEDPELGIVVKGVVSEVADRPGTQGVDAQHVYLQVKPDEAPEQLVGASVKLTIQVESTEGDVLAVPVSALSVTADGKSRVQVLDGDKTRFVEVRPGLAAGGLVEVKPVNDALAPHDQVVVGDRSGRPAAAGGGGDA
jgi:multidrug efflux pump subunit AcrA (membrane-fusion protein)